MTKDEDPRKVQESLSITLEGDGIKAGTINALALGEALVGVTDLARELGKIGEYREHGAPEVRVVATAEGSFVLELTLETLGQWWAATRGVLTGPDATAIANLAGFVALLGEVVATLKRKGRRQVTDTKVTPDGQVEVARSPPPLSEGRERHRATCERWRVTSPRTTWAIPAPAIKLA